MSITVTLHDKELLLSAIADVRKDNTNTNWVIITHKDENLNILELEASGTDGYEGLISRLKPDKVQYALLRVTTKVDLSITIKFVYIHWIGDEVPFAKRGKFNIVHGSAVTFFEPFHVDFDITTKSEISETLIRDKVEMAAGNANFVRSADFAIGKPEFGKNQTQKSASNATLTKLSAPGSQSNLTATCTPRQGSIKSSSVLGRGSGNVATQATGTCFDPSFTEEIQELRNDKSTLKWVCGTFKEGNIKLPIILKESGSTSSVESLKQSFDSSLFLYYLLKVIDVIDGHPTTKFVFITAIGNDISMMNKAKVATYKGALSELFAPFHVDFVVSEKKEISDSIVMEKVQQASGSKLR